MKGQLFSDKEKEDYLRQLFSCYSDEGFSLQRYITGPSARLEIIDI